MIKISFKPPIVSIILATYNRYKYLKKCIDSVLSQTYNDWELIVVDDGGADDTFSLINEYLTNFENIRYIKHKNRKLPFSRLASAGEIITFIDSDDEYKPEHLQLRADYLNSHKQIDLIYGGIVIIGDPYVKDKNDISKTIHLRECVVGGTFFGKRKVFFELNGFNNLKYSEDSEFLRRAKVQFNIEKVDFATYIYRRDLTSGICKEI